MLRFSPWSLTRYALFGSLLLLAACSDNSSSPPPAQEPLPEEPAFLAIANPEVSLPPDIGAPLDFGIVNLASVGYEQQEYFVAGTATSFGNVNEFDRDGLWEAEPAEEADYATRVLVRRPIDANHFNGTVVVEWMNVSSGFDTTPEWDNGHVEMIRSGYIWVGVSAQLVGIEGRENSFVPFHLKGINPERYAELLHPGDSFSYDMFSQVAQSLRNPGAIDPLNGMVPERLIGSGLSQSAFFLTTYVNAVHPLYNPYDGYIIHSRGAYSAPLSMEPQTQIETPAEVLIRTDLNVPVLTLQSETDVLRGTLNSVLSRQDDTDNLRLWEVTGTSHSDRYSSGVGWTDAGDDPSAAAVRELDNIQGFIQCDLPMNSGPMHYVFNAALHGMNEWIIGGTPPPLGAPLDVSDDLMSFVLDDNGNVTGGIRTPYVDAPVAVLSGLGQSGESFCGLFGVTALYSNNQLASLYVDQAGYVDAVTTATNAAVEERFLLPADGAQIIEWAPQQWDEMMAREEPMETAESGPLFNFRYCEVLLVSTGVDEIIADVYNSMGLNFCPQEQWDALDTDQIAMEFERDAAFLNGPRFWVLDWIVANSLPASGGGNVTALFGDIEMRLAASVIIPAAAPGEGVYQVNRVSRDTVFQYYAGRRVYMLTDADGRRYMMQSFSRIVDSDLQLEELVTLSSRLSLPDGWSFKSFILTESFDLHTIDAIAEVVTDDLSNTYQLIPEGVEPR